MAQLIEFKTAMSTMQKQLTDVSVNRNNTREELQRQAQASSTSPTPTPRKDKDKLKSTTPDVGAEGRRRLESAFAQAAEAERPRATSPRRSTGQAPPKQVKINEETARDSKHMRRDEPHEMETGEDESGIA
eukprot:4411343-Pyramimonas_sp.AAC.1